MPPWTAIGVSCPNIAFMKYWGNRDKVLRIPVNGSISMNLDGLYARTQVTFEPGLAADMLTLGGRRRAERHWNGCRSSWSGCEACRAGLAGPGDQRE